MLMVLSPTVLAQTPTVGLDGAAATPLIGEPVCTAVSFTNTAPAEGFGPYLFVTVPPGVSVSAPTFLGIPPQVDEVGTIDGSGMIADPVSGQVVAGEPGGTAYVVRYPVGSVVQGQPPLVLDVCVTVEPGVEIGVPLAVNILPGFEYGDTPTGDNGPITGNAATTATITPQIARVEKTANVPEGERPPGPDNEYSYTYTVDVSQGVPITQLVLTDSLPPELQWTGGPVTVTPIQGVLCQATALPNAPPTPGGTLVVQCATLVGTAQVNDLTVNLPVYITDILDETDGGSTLLVSNQVSLAYQFQGMAHGNADDAEVVAKHVALQKVASPPVVVPGDIASFGIHFQTTDYTDGGESLSAFVIEDVLDDGLAWAGNASLVFNGAPAVPVTPTVTPGPGAGQTTLTFDIVQETGGAIPLGWRGNLSYDAEVLQTYADGDPVLASDPLGNDADVGYTHTEGANGSDGATAGVTVAPTQPQKSLVAPVPLPDPLAPGDTVTFRLELDIPSEDTVAISITDFLPLPVLFVTDIDPATDITVPNLPGITDVPPVYSQDVGANSFTLTWPDPAGLGFERVAADITVTITDLPFADGLFLTNLMQSSSTNSMGEVNTRLIARGFNVGAPDVFVTKGVQSVANPGATISPAPPADPATALSDSDASGADAGDLVEYVITVENRGSQSAYNVEITDPAVPGLACQPLAAADVTNALGQPVAFTGTSLQAGITVPGPLAANDGVPLGGGAPFGADTLLVRHRCIVATGAVPGETLTNTVTMSFTATSGANDTFPERSDSASLTLASPGVNKTITAITPGYAGNLQRAQVGEMVSYQVVITVPEGTSPQVQFDDVLNPGLALVALDSIIASPGLTTSVGSFDPGVIANAAFVAQGGGNENLDRRLLIGPTDGDFGFGTVVNADTDNGVAETITLNYRARVINASGNVRGTQLHNRARWTWASAGGRGEVQDFAPNVTVTEPTLEVTKQFVPDTADRGNPSTIHIRLRHTGGSDATAFDVSVLDVFPLGVTPDAGSATTLNCNLAPDLYSVTVPQLNVAWDAFPVGSDCTLVFDTTGNPPIPAGTVLTNCAQSRWTSLDAAGEALPPAPANPLTVERTGNTAGPGGAANTYEDEGCANLKIFDVGIAKTVFASNQAGTVAEGGVEDLAIGERVNFLLTATLPEGPTTQLVIRDTLPASGMVLEALSATVRPLPVDTRLTVPGGLPLPALSDQLLGDGLDDTVIVTFPQVISNTPDGVVDARDRIEVEVLAVVKNLPVNQNGAQEDNLARVSFGNGLSGQDTVPVRAVEPLLSVTKTADHTSVQAGDAIAYSLLVQHLGGSRADAFDVALNDQLPPELLLDPASVAVGGDCTAAPDGGPAGAGDTVSASWSAFPLGARCEIVFTATVDVSAVSGADIVNAADIAWTSLDDTTTELADERSYADDAEWPVTVADPGLVKLLVDSDIAQTVGEQVTIGETVTFEITVTFPDGTTEAVTVADVLPPTNGAVELLSATITAVGADLAFSNTVNPGDPGDDCLPDCSYGDQGFDDSGLWLLGDVENAPNASPGTSGPDDQVVFEVIGIVKDLPINQGIPAGVDHLFNTAGLDSLNLRMADQAPITLVEPRLALRQFIAPDSKLDVVNASEVLNVGLTVSHLPDSSATAFGLVLSDTLDPDVLWVDDATVSSDCPGLVVDSSMAGAVPAVITFSFDELPLAQGSCTIDYQVMTSASLPVLGLYTDQSTLDWESAPGSPESRGGTDSDFIVLLSPTDGALSKRLVNTSVLLTGTAQGDATLQDLTIGEVVTYELVAGFTTGTTSGVSISDTLPATMAIEGATVQAVGGSLTTTLPGTPLIVANTVSFDFGDVTNIDDGMQDLDDAIVVRIAARVLDVGGPAGGDTLGNDAELVLGPVTRNAMASVDVVEPVLTLAKQFGEPALGRVEVTLTVGNAGTGPAFSAAVSDVFDESIWVAGSMLPVTVPDGWSLEAASAGGQTTVTFATAGDPPVPAPSQVLLPGGSRTAVFSMELVSPLTLTSIPNTADATANSLRAQDPAARETTAQAMDSLLLPLLDSDKAWSGPNNPAEPGDVLTYTVTVSNTGVADANDVVVSDTPDPLGQLQPFSVSTSGIVLSGNLPGETTVEVRFASIAAGASASFSYEVVVPYPYPADVAMEFVNQAIIASRELPDFASNDPATGPDDDPTVAPIVAAPVMQILKDDVSNVAGAGGTISWELNYGNTGNQDATGVHIDESVPDHTVFNAAASSPGWSCPDGSPAGTACTLQIGDLGAGSGGIVYFSVTVNNPLPMGVTQVFNTAMIEDDSGSTDDDDDDTLIAAVPVLDITKDDGGISTVPGGVVVYSLDYVNNGTQEATGVRLFDTVPANSVFDAAASAPFAWSCPDGSPAGTQCILDVGDLQGGGAGAGTASFAVRVVEPLPAGVDQLLNVVLIADDGNNSALAPVIALALDTTPVIAQPDLVITKQDNGVVGRPGVVIPYRLSYQQVGNQAATGVVISETVPAGTTYAAVGSLPNVWSCPDGSPAGTLCTLAVGDMAVDAGGMARFGVRVDDPVPAGQSEVVNTVVIADDGANGPDPTPANNTDTVATLVILFRPAGRKTAEQIDAHNVMWRMVWFNNLNTTDLPVSIRDPIPAHSTYVDGSVQCTATGASQCLSAVYNATEERIEVSAIIAEDFGAPDDAGEAALDNEIVISFVTRIAQGGGTLNTADACWDENNTGTADDDRAMGQDCVEVQAGIRAFIPVPALGPLAAGLLILLLAGIGLRGTQRARG